MISKIKKIARISVVIGAYLVLVCGVGLVAPIYCSADINICTPASNRTPWEPFAQAHCQQLPSNDYSSIQPTIHVSENAMPDFNTEGTCCSAETSGVLNYSTYINSTSSFPQTDNSKVAEINHNLDLPRVLSFKFREKPIQITPIYILTKTIIC
jgi:hypothetical protein